MPVQENCTVISHRKLAEALYLIEFTAPFISREAMPGQFVHVNVAPFHDPLLRRPISIFDIDRDKGKLSLLYRVVGRGTSVMTSYQPGDLVDIMGPLGSGFTISELDRKVLVIGGGVGIAPLFYLSRLLIESHHQVEMWFGTNNKESIGISRQIDQLGVAFKPCTMDGSAGHKGLVTDLFEGIDPSSVGAIYSCGPEAMMASVAAYAHQHKIWCEVSLEEHMACGVGACLGCARQLKKGDAVLAKICKDGPVFNINEVDLNPGEVLA